MRYVHIGGRTATSGNIAQFRFSDQSDSMITSALSAIAIRQLLFNETELKANEHN